MEYIKKIIVVGICLWMCSCSSSRINSSTLYHNGIRVDSSTDSLDNAINQMIMDQYIRMYNGQK